MDHHHQAARLDIVVGGVMQDVTVQHPLTCFCGNELDVIPFARRNADCVLGQLHGFWDGMPIGRNNLERHAMQMNEVDKLSECNKA